MNVSSDNAILFKYDATISRSAASVVRRKVESFICSANVAHSEIMLAITVLVSGLPCRAAMRSIKSKRLRL